MLRRRKTFTILTRHATEIELSLTYDQKVILSLHDLGYLDFSGHLALTQICDILEKKVAQNEYEFIDSAFGPEFFRLRFDSSFV